jgi:hypothetical protein
MRAMRLWIVATVAALCGVPIKVRESFMRSEEHEALTGSCGSS